MRNSSSKSGKSIAWAIAFLGLLLCIILASFIWKFVVFVQKSTFDTIHQYNVLVYSSPQRIVSFNPDEHAIFVVTFIGKASNPQQFLEVPVDAQISGGKDNDLGHMFLGAVIHDGKTISPIDAIKLWWFASTISTDKIINARISGLENPAEQTIPKLFQDKSLYAQGESIAIINGAGVSGLGNRLAKLLTNIGANVIMVSTADQNTDHSMLIYAGSASYTEDRLGQILHIQPVAGKTTPALSDITITIGKDMAQTVIF